MCLRFPKIGVNEKLQLLLGGVVTVLFLADPGGPNVVGALIGLSTIGLSIWYIQRLKLWARREGYDLISMSVLLWKKPYGKILPNSSVFNVTLRCPDGGEKKAFVAFPVSDISLKNSHFFEIVDETVV